MPLPTRVALLLLLTIGAGSACSSSTPSCEEGPFGGATCTVGGEIVTGNSVLFNGEEINYSARALYGFGPGLPEIVLWTTSDPLVLDIENLQNNTARVTAIDTGSAWVFALINAEFEDSALVTVVVPGGTRWASTFSGVPVGRYPAIGVDSMVRVVTGGANPLLQSFTPDSGVATTAASCFSTFGPSLGPVDMTFATGPDCTRRHARNGDPQWTAPAGNASLGVAVALDDGAVTVSGDSVYRIDTAGSIAWAMPLGGTPQTVPVIGPGGDVYVGWRAGGADSVSRFATDGTPRWSIPVPGLSAGTPAVSGGRLLFGRRGGLFALDSAGTIEWDRAFSDVNAAATATSETSSPVHDGVTAFVQNEEALYSYALDGTFVWVADSLGYGTSSGPVGAPVLLGDLTLVVPCTAPAGGRGVCTVQQVSGEIRWRSPTASGDVTGLAVGADGTIFATRTLAGGNSQLTALWARVAPMITGWPAEGGNQRHTRRR